ncbi:MAG: hypothetical protein CL933_03840 [Deltaproteobacteria bacterium]|nr:hypothetical protein [Deltaproteobacteria bacterium]
MVNRAVHAVGGAFLRVEESIAVGVLGAKRASLWTAESGVNRIFAIALMRIACSASTSTEIPQYAERKRQMEGWVGIASVSSSGSLLDRPLTCGARIRVRASSRTSHAAFAGGGADASLLGRVDAIGMGGQNDAE